MTNHGQFDEQLDHALSEYRDAEPLYGLEDRVLQRLQSQPVERRFGWWRWAAIATCAGLVLVAIWIGIVQRSHPAWPTQPTQAREQVSPPVSSPGSKEVARVTKRTTPPKAGGVGHPAPALVARPETSASNPAENSQFPTPAPLTEEEHALFALLHSNPNVLPKQPDDPSNMAIAPLEIKPLAGSAAPAQENSNE